MFFHPVNHGENKPGRFIYKGGVSAEYSVSLPETQKSDPEALPEVKYNPDAKTHDEVWRLIDEKYGLAPYESIISSYVDQIMPTSPEGYKDAIVKNSLGRYQPFYLRVQDLFMKEAGTLLDKFNLALSRVKKQTTADLAVLKSSVEGSRQLAEFNKPMPSPENKGEVKDYFSDYLDALNGRYLNLDVNEGVPVPGGVSLLGPLFNPDTKVLDRQAHPEEHVNVPLLGIFIGSDVLRGAGERGYRNLSQKFRDNMETWMTLRLDYLLERPNLKPSDLEAFREEITSRYERYSRLDGNSAIISLKDLAILESVANGATTDMVERVLDDRDDKDIARLEVMQVMNPDGWQKTVQEKGEAVIDNVEATGSEKLFVKALSKHKKVEDFGDAKSAYRRILKQKSQVSVTETESFFQEINDETFGDIVKQSRSIQPPALSMQVYKQLDYLKTGALVPEKETDRMLVNFMNADREGRNDILANNGTRDILFRAIKQATQQYTEIYEQRYRNIPDDPKKLTISKDIEKPTGHDRAAQLQALIILGHEAEAIVLRLNETEDHEDKDYREEMDRVELPDIKMVRTGLRHKSPATGRAVFRSRLERGGFNTRDLALKGAKVLGVLAVVSNFAQSYSDSSGDDFLDRLANTFENAATNPGLLAGAAVATGAYVAERDPTLLRWPWLSEYGRDGVVTRFKLSRLEDRLGRRPVQNFVQNNSEWRALKHPAMDASKIGELIKEAGKRSKGGQKPVIKASDLEKIIPDKSITATLTPGYAGDRVRFLFYSKFMAGSKKPDVNHVKELCTGSSLISDSPIQPNSANKTNYAHA